MSNYSARLAAIATAGEKSTTKMYVLGMTMACERTNSKNIGI